MRMARQNSPKSAHEVSPRYGSVDSLSAWPSGRHCAPGRHNSEWQFGHQCAGLCGGNRVFPGITREEEARWLGLGPATLSPLGKKVLALRAQAIASGMPLISSWEDLDREMTEIRGEHYPDDE